MAGIRVKERMRKGEKIIGRVDSVGETTVSLELDENGDKKIKLPLPESVLETLNDDYDGSIVEIHFTESGEYEIEEKEDFPKAKKD